MSATGNSTILAQEKDTNKIEQRSPSIITESPSASLSQTIKLATPCHTHQWSRKLISAVHSNKTWTRLLPTILSCAGPSLHIPPVPAARAKPRAVLSRAEAIEIYLCKLARVTAHPPAPSAAAVARAFAVSEKTVRDIWKGRTWAHETSAIVPAPRLPASPPVRATAAPAAVSTCPAVEASHGDAAIDAGGDGGESGDGSGAQQARDSWWLFEPAGTACGGGGRECADPFHDDWPHWDPATPPPLVDPPPLPPPDW